jgi:retinol dehydrogenase 12
LYVLFLPLLLSPLTYLDQNLILYPAPYGALTQLWAGTSPETKDYNGKFFKPWARIGDAGAPANDPETAAKLWQWIEEQRKGH